VEEAVMEPMVLVDQAVLGVMLETQVIKATVILEIQEQQVQVEMQALVEQVVQVVTVILLDL